METTCDWILGHRVQLEQPRKGFRVAIDTVLLAAAARVEEGESALELGCGVGGAMLALAARVPRARILGIEIQPELVELCRRNIERNSMTDRAQVVEGDIGRMRGAIPSLDKQDPSFPFDHILMNPPYHEANKHDLSQNQSKSRANAEQEGELAQWFAFAAAALKTGGGLTMIHRADRLESLLAQAAAAKLGGGEIVRVLPRENAPALRVILRLEKGTSSRPREGQALVMHEEGGGYTREAEEVLRHAKGV